HIAFHFVGCVKSARTHPFVGSRGPSAPTFLGNSLISQFQFGTYRIKSTGKERRAPMKRTLIFVLLLHSLAAAPQGYAAGSFQDAIQNGDPRKGIELFTGLIKEMPERIELYLLRATCYQQIKEYEKAIADYNKAIELDNSQPAIFVRRGK